MSQEQFYQTVQLQEEFLDRAQKAFEFQQTAVKLMYALEHMRDAFCADGQWVGVPIYEEAQDALDEFYELMFKWSDK